MDERTRDVFAMDRESEVVLQLAIGLRYGCLDIKDVRPEYQLNTVGIFDSPSSPRALSA